MKCFLPLKPKLRVAPPAKSTWIPGRGKERLEVIIPFRYLPFPHYDFNEWIQKCPHPKLMLELPEHARKGVWRVRSGVHHHALIGFLEEALKRLGYPAQGDLAHDIDGEQINLTVTLPAKEGHWQPRPLSRKLTQQTR